MPLAHAPKKTTRTAGTTGTTAGTAANGPAPAAPAPWLALLATPAAAAANAPVLILDDIAGSWGVGTATATWFVQVFAWAMAVGTPLVGGLVRLRGPRYALRLSALLVLAGTVALVAAPWLPLALAGRAAQALGAAGLITVAMGLAAGDARRMGVVSAGFGVLGAVGPLLGSWVAGALSWRIALAVSVVSLLAVPVVARCTAAGRPDPGARFDGRGAALLLTLVTALVMVPRHPALALAAAVVPAVLLVLHVRARSEGFVPLAVLRAPGFVPSALLAGTLSTSYFTLLFAIPRLLAGRTEWSPAAIGTGQLVALLTGSVVSWLLAAASARLGHRRLLAVLVTAGAAAPLTALLSPWAPALLGVAALAVFATVAGQATLSVRAAAQVVPTQRPAAIGLFALCYQLGGAFGPALAVLLLG
ncbi:MFS transporter [Streptomyces sp. WAC06614]|uniref:MFS transporter n=1 Tax=Streptomyces sp. WAC06614 TaxID=2487416 RepID=UPI000F79966F|nr:MFS transporter [Streptomyces sp. WAC06614]RSS84409.1 MFS transporter [Streptomyces sp. WAC06614]